MMNLRAFFEATPADYPNHLASPEPEATTVSPAPWLLAGLVLLCFLPRALLALKTETICPDGILYIRLASALSEGDLQEGLQEMHLNTFPVLLMLLHRLGLDCDLAGKWWGVVISSLVVLPMYGWARRQFDDRVALAACLLYAVHANLIECSPELIRGPTFWFLFMLSIYLLWRAVTEVRLGLFMASGAAITLASLTRVEGLFLFIPLVLWSAWRWLALSRSRRQLLLGVMLSVVFFPVVLLLINVTWLRDHPSWEFMRLRPLALVQTWVEALVGSAPGAAVDSSGGVVEFQARMSSGQMLWTLVHTLERGLTPLFALLMLGGLWSWRRVWGRRDHQPLFYIALTLMGGMWIHLYHTQVSSYRYPLPIALMGSVFAALGLLGLSAWMLRLADRRQWGRKLQCVVALAPLVMVGTVGLADALTKNYDVRESWAGLGRWVREEFGPWPSLIGPHSPAITANYYAQGRCHAFRNDIGDDRLVELARQIEPDVVLLWASQAKSERGKALVSRINDLGFKQVDRSRLPRGSENVLVLAQDHADLRVARNVSRIPDRQTESSSQD